MEMGKGEKCGFEIWRKMVLKYNWWVRSKSVGKLFEVELNDEMVI